MEDIRKYFEKSLLAGAKRFIISNPVSKTAEYKKITADKKPFGFQISKYTEKQVFHENVSENELAFRCAELVYGNYKQVNGFAKNNEHILLISKKGASRYSVKENGSVSVPENTQHNREKNYILSQGENIPPLVDMGAVTKDGKVINAPNDTYVTVELVADGVPQTRSVLSDANSWTHTFTNLPTTDSKGNEIVYSVTEYYDDEEWVSAVDGDAENGFTVTNTKKEKAPDTPQTGDNSKTGLWIAMASASFVLVIVFTVILICIAKKHDEEDEEQK